MSGHYKGIFVSTNFLLFSWSQCYPIGCCGTWFRFNHESLVAMFANPKYISNDSNFEDNVEAYGDEKGH